MFRARCPWRSWQGRERVAWRQLSWFLEVKVTERSFEHDNIADPVSAMGTEPLLAHVAQSNRDRCAGPDLAAHCVEERRRVGVWNRRRGGDDRAGSGER